MSRCYVIKISAVLCFMWLLVYLWHIGYTVFSLHSCIQWYKFPTLKSPSVFHNQLYYWKKFGVSLEVWWWTFSLINIDCEDCYLGDRRRQRGVPREVSSCSVSLVNVMSRRLLLPVLSPGPDWLLTVDRPPSLTPRQSARRLQHHSRRFCEHSATTFNGIFSGRRQV